MRCPNCGKTYDAGNQCPHCQIDAVLFKGTERLSDRLYNKGLSRLHSMDFTNGIQELHRSVSINKHNIRARNLLGLALFEIGHIGEALKHWIISRSHLRENNPANNYIDKLTNNTRDFERLNEAVVLYNRALDFVKQKSDDLAVIQLKKSLEYNPRFVDSLNLLTLCYLQQRNRQQANATMERVFAIDVRNPIALRYHAILNPTRPRPETRTRTIIKQPAQPGATQDKPSDTGPFKTVTIKESKSSHFHFVGILSFIVGAAVMMGVGIFLYIPALQREHTIAMQNANRQVEAATAARQAEIDAYIENETRFREQIKGHDHAVEEMQTQINHANRAVNVYVANERFRAGTIEDMRAAVGLLEITPLDDLPFDTVSIANHINETAFPLLATHYANEGINAFNAGDYGFALNQLEDAMRFIVPYNPQYPHVLYHLGTLYYRATGREAEAISVLSLLVTLEGYAAFPSNPWGSRRTRVQDMLGNLGQ
ncbi:MAG: hypothetical protein FWE90_07015 [Defluviitaleaceae bacterium]|nr:hypothetical protein [Defluviitaleaceae bacterium]